MYTRGGASSGNDPTRRKLSPHSGEHDLSLGQSVRASPTLLHFTFFRLSETERTPCSQGLIHLFYSMADAEVGGAPWSGDTGGLKAMRQKPAEVSFFW